MNIKTHLGVITSSLTLVGVINPCQALKWMTSSNLRSSLANFVPPWLKIQKSDYSNQHL